MASGASSSLSLFLLHAKEMVSGLTSVGSRDCNWDEARESDRDEGSDVDDMTGRGAQMLTTGRGAQRRASGVRRAQRESKHRPLNHKGRLQARTKVPHLKNDHPHRVAVVDAP